MTTDIRTILDFVLAERLRDICERRGLSGGGSRAEQRERVVRSLGGDLGPLLPLLTRAELVEFLATRDLDGRFAFVSRASRWDLERLLTMVCAGHPGATDDKPLGESSPIRFERRVARPRPWPIDAPPPPEPASSVSEKVFRSRVQRQRGFVYYVKDGDVWAAPSRHGGSKRAPHRVHEAGIPTDHVTYLYYIDGDGDIARKRRDGGPLDGSTGAGVGAGPRLRDDLDVARAGAVRVFIGYARHDLGFLEELIRALSPYEGTRELALFFDRRAAPGTEWEPALLAELMRAEIAILLVSSDFFSSRYCYEVEWPLIRERHRRGDCELAPVLIRACRFERSALGAYQFIRPNNQAVADHSQRDAAWTNVAVALETLIDRVRAKRR